MEYESEYNELITELDERLQNMKTSDYSQVVNWFVSRIVYSFIITRKYIAEDIQKHKDSLESVINKRIKYKETKLLIQKDRIQKKYLLELYNIARTSIENNKEVDDLLESVNKHLEEDSEISNRMGINIEEIDKNIMFLEDNSKLLTSMIAECRDKLRTYDTLIHELKNRVRSLIERIKADNQLEHVMRAYEEFEGRNEYNEWFYELAN